MQSALALEQSNARPLNPTKHGLNSVTAPAQDKAPAPVVATSGGPPISRYGLSQIYAPEGGAQVDVVFVHGLNGDPHNTWTSDKSKVFWPQQLLPPILEEERARILVYGYDADVTSFTDGASRDKIHNHAEHLTAELAANRRIRKATERPIIFVAHSLGGLVVKRALIYSSEIRGNYTEHLRSIFVSTYGILFLGTPHKGSDLAKWGSRLEAICHAVMPKKAVDSNDALVNALKSNNETLQNIDRQFIQLTNRFHIFFFHEGKPTDLKGTVTFIVDEDSASPTIQDVERAVIQADHSHMCKFESENAPGFDLVAEGIQRYAGEAQRPIATRWQAEKAERIAKKTAEVEEIMPDTSQILPPKTTPKLIDTATNAPTSPAKSSEPYFIVPPGFRPNTFFVGLQREYTELDKQLFGRKRNDGTACVLLWGQPGGGKSHLARQYVNKNRRRFPGGIFWITAKSIHETQHAFWNIRAKVICRDSPEICENVKPNDFIQLVRTWFESRHEWLIVFDGVTLDRDEDATEFASFIPDSKDSSIIYVSRAKNLEKKQRLLRPTPIKVGPLKDDEGKKLLFKELRIKKPTDAENRKALELVKKVGGLPLAINAISRRLADTHEPLTKYKLSTSVDPTIEGTYLTILDDLQRLNHMEAWTLISILCWFAQDLPFEMVHLGLKILRAEGVEVRSREGTGTPDIDNTVAILMRYALLERNEPDEKESASSSRDSLCEPEPIDMLKIHTAVQNFCCESLNSSGLLPKYLGYAVKLFSYSYYQADVRIKSKPEPGRVSDYRYYETHGNWLWDHVTHYESKSQSLEGIRDELSPTLHQISEEIRTREPGSSQESLHHGIFQVSIFDRTSSSSDSGPIGPSTPNHHPTPPPLANENDFGFPIGTAMDSPASVGTVSPGVRPKILGTSPRLPSYEDIGYESDRSGGHHKTPMQRDFSESTARPPTPPRRSRAPTSSSQGGEWHVVRKPRKQPRGRRDLGSFRPTPSKAQVNRQSVSGSIQRSVGQKENRRGSSPALKSLANVQSRSPPQSRAGVASLFPGGAPKHIAPTVPTKPTWAGIAAGKVAPLSEKALDNSVDETRRPSQAPIFANSGGSPSPSRIRPGSSGTAGPSPLASEFLPSISNINDQRRNLNAYNQNAAPYPDSNPNHVQYPESRPMTNHPQSYYPPYPLGPNPAPLPYEDNVSLTTKRPLPPEFQSEQQPSAFSSPESQYQPSPPSHTSPYQQPYNTSPPTRTSPYNISPRAQYPPFAPPPLPTGYSSQPMSRNTSHVTTTSLAETDPQRYPSPKTNSPQFPPYSTSPSSRERYPDGRAYRKSPKTQFPSPAAATVFPSPPQQPPYDYDPTAAGPMSRSSSGPGIALDGSMVQFGDHAPLSISEARARTLEYQQHLQERERSREAMVLAEMEEERERRGREGAWERANAEEGDGRGKAYPDFNVIPTGSDRRASEGMGKGEGEGAVGLGVEIGR
ncbi:hypothetical protein ACLMJK_000065 [Lecanora helva]